MEKSKENTPKEINEAQNTTAESVSSTNETVRVNVFPPHLRDTSYDIWLHSSYAITNEEKLKQSFESQICNPQCCFDGDKEKVASTVIGELSQQMPSQARKLVEFLEKAESDKQQRLEVTCAEQQTTKIRLQNALTELEITRAEMVKVQRENVRKLALESYKHAEEITSLEEKNSATIQALEQTQIEAGQLKSSLESSLIQLANTEGQLKEALDRENSLKEELKKLQNEQESRPEATFRYVIPNFKKAKTERSLSNATMVRNLAWRIMIEPTNVLNEQKTTKQKYLGFFLQCNADSESTSWSCQAAAELRLVSQKEGVENFTRKVQYLFGAKEDHWGFRHYMSWSDICNPEKGYIKEDCVILEVHLVAEAPQFGVSLDSKELTGYVDLKK